MEQKELDELIKSRIDEIMKLTVEQTIEKISKEKFKVTCPECGHEFEFEFTYKVKK